MNFSKTTEYALRILSFMATRAEDNYSSEYLYSQLNIPRRYLRRLMTELSAAGFIMSTRGRNGGFVFARDPGSISLQDIVDASEGPLALNRCILGFSCCLAGTPCAMHDEWLEAGERVKRVLRETTLASLRDKYRVAGATGK